MIRPRLTIRRLMVVVAIVAVAALPLRPHPTKEEENLRMARDFLDGKGAPEVINGYRTHFGESTPEAVRVMLYHPGDYKDYRCFRIDCDPGGGYATTISFTEEISPKIDGR